MRRLLLCCSLMALIPAGMSAEDPTSRAIDADVWTEISRTVVAADIDAMARVYHSDAVLVSANATVPIAEALARWGAAMEDAEAEGSTATVSFRFTSRQASETTAFETGIFCYTATDRDGVTTPVYVPFEALLVRREDRWLLLMERQLPPTDAAAWTALDPART